MKNINKNKTEFNSLEFERLIQEELKTNPDYFKGEVVDNGDCRGFTLKIDSDYMRDNKIYPFYSDWGNYGIIAPSFRES